jgi:catechol 2,3-dioxygenase-like lactoylglutathione lyase family enzyme
MPELNRGIDHLVLCARDLARARKRYRALGFTTTPPALHPFGTGNSLVQLQGNFLELIAVVEPENIAPREAGEFGFGGHVRHFLGRREGMAMLVFESQDAVADQAEFAAKKGVETYAPLHFQRQAKQPDGSSVTVAFSLAFATSPALPEAVFFTCQQHAPQYFWKPEYQTHANGARMVAEVVMVAPSPGDLAGFLGQLQTPGAVRLDGGALRMTTARGDLRVVTPDHFERRFGTPPPGSASPHFAAYRIVVDAIEETMAVLDGNAMAYRRIEDCVIVDADSGLGVVIAFSEME